MLSYRASSAVAKSKVGTRGLGVVRAYRQKPADTPTVYASAYCHAKAGHAREGCSASPFSAFSLHVPHVGHTT